MNAMKAPQTIVLTDADRIRLQSIVDHTLQIGAESRHCIEDLQRELNRARIVDPARLPEDIVTMNSTVRLRDLDSNEVETYTLVYPQDADIVANRISVLAPVGTAIIGCRVDDVVEWPVPRGRVRWRIESVEAPAAASASENDQLVFQF